MLQDKRRTRHAVPSALGVELLPPEERSLFAQAFERELDFLQMLLLLVSRAFPVKNVDLIWADAMESGRVSVRQGTGITQALRNPYLRQLHGAATDPNPRFCNLVNDFGKKDPETCFISDWEAAKRARRTGKTQVYRCHAGIVDIAVPVRAGNRYLATLHCGQCLAEPPSEQGFVEIKKNVARLDYVDLNTLKDAYHELPVVPESAMQDTVRVLEIFAEYLGRLWQHLRDGVRLQRQRLREGQLLRTEFAHLMLEGAAPGGRDRIRSMMKRLGFTHYPNRVLLVSLQPHEEDSAGVSSFDLAFTVALHAIEELSERTRDTATAYLRRYGVCFFLHDPADPGTPGSDLRVRGLARRILGSISERCDIRARVGIGGLVTDWHQLPESYEEARLALSTCLDAVAVYRNPSVELAGLEQETKAVCGLLEERKFDEAKLRLMSIPALLFAGGRSSSSRPAVARQAFLSVLESLCITAQKLGCAEIVIGGIRATAQAAIESAQSAATAAEVFLGQAARLIAEVRRLHAGKHEKIAGRARQMIEWNIEHRASEASLSLESVAAALNVSPAHLSRVFRQVVGMPFQNFVIARRIDLAKRLLLDPLYSVAQVSEACGYANPAYFARLFRRATGCLPRDYVKNPMRSPV